MATTISPSCPNINDNLKPSSNDEGPTCVTTSSGADDSLIVAQISPKIKRQRLASQLIATVIVSWEAIITGYASAYTSPADLSMTHALNITQEQLSWISGLLPVGALIGSVSGGSLIEYLGRRYTLLVTDIVFLAAWLVNFLATSGWHMYVSRFAVGCSVGITSFTIPVYLAETIQPKIRGRLGLFPSIFGNFGILLCFILGNWLNWHDLAGVGVLLPLPFFVFIWLIPETPRWYISHRNIEESKKSLQWLRGVDCNIEAEFEELLHKRIVINTNQNDKKKSPVQRGLLLIFTKHYIQPFMIVMGLMFFQQFSGINAVIFYTTQIFKQSGSSLDSYVCTAIVGIVNFLSTFIASFFIDKFGRKVLLYISGALMGISLSVLGVYFFLLKVEHLNMTQQFGWVPLTSFILYVLGFSLGFGPIPWLMMGELLPAAIRGHAASICTAFNWSCTFIVTKTFPQLIDLLGSHGTYWLFCGLIVLSLFFVRVYVPETKRKTLEEIEKLLARD